MLPARPPPWGRARRTRTELETPVTRTASAILALFALSLAAPTSVAAPPPSKTLQDSDEVLEALSALKEQSIPPALLGGAHGVAIIPKVIKAGFVFGGRGGHGVVIPRDLNGNWGEPVFVNIGGASVGFQAGVESTDVVLVFRTRNSLDRILEGKNKLTLGADAAVAAGPVGRQASAATDGKLEAEIYSYSRSRGLFAGVSLGGAVINPDADTNALVKRGMTPEEAKMLAAVKTRLSAMSALPAGAAPARP